VNYQEYLFIFNYLQKEAEIRAQGAATHKIQGEMQQFKTVW